MTTVVPRSPEAAAPVRKQTSRVSAADFLPPRRTLKTLQVAAAGCEGCHLYLPATQTVFGEGPGDARVMLVGEQPGDIEDQAGHPFVGPAGRLLDRALEEAGLERSEVYVTNAVKHFKFEQRGKARLHKRPGASEVSACLPWLRAEIALIQPELLVLLGATAAQALLGPTFRITKQRGRPIPSELAQFVLATAHPSSVLRAPCARNVTCAALALHLLPTAWPPRTIIAIG